MTEGTDQKGSSAWCCVAFKGAFDEAGQRAFAILVDRSPEGYDFILQHRALEPDDPGPKNHPGPISIVSQIHIHFCPWCGRSLQEFYRARLAEMVRPGLTIPEP
jgi:hypothetical protein